VATEGKKNFKFRIIMSMNFPRGGYQLHNKLMEKYLGGLLMESFGEVGVMAERNYRGERASASSCSKRSIKYTLLIVYTFFMISHLF